MTRQLDYGISGEHFLIADMAKPAEGRIRAQSRSPIQVLDEARDAIQTLHVGATTIISGSVDGYIRTYDLRKGELRSDFIGRKFILPLPLVLTVTLDYRSCNISCTYSGWSNTSSCFA